jgi:hypothetical protein
MPITTCLHKISYSFAPNFKKLKEKIVSEMMLKPMLAGTLTPIRSEILPPIGAITITVSATGKINIPTFDGENSKIFWRKKGTTKVCAPLIQKEKRLVPREEVKILLLRRWRSTKGEGDRSSTTMNRLKQNKLRKNHPQKR